MKKRILSIMLALCMVLALMPQMASAANGTPSVTAYATKAQLMDVTFAPDSTSGTAANIGKLAFGKNSSRQTQEWYILGKDTGVTGDNTVVFAASPIVTGNVFDGSSFDLNLDGGENKKTDANLNNDCSYNGATPSEVYRNHYGASALRDKLQSIATEKNHFTEAEQNMMNATTVTTKDTKNSANYTTTDKLYALAADGFGDSYKTIKAGSSNQKVLAMERYWKDEKVGFWLRSPGENIKHPLSHDSCFAFYANSGSKVEYHTFVAALNVQPASNLNLSNVLFASAATAATSSMEAKFGKIASETAMTLRLDGSSKNIGSAIYNAEKGAIEVRRGYTSLPVALIVQGNDGTDDWYYSEKIIVAGETKLMKAADIKSALNLSSDIDLSSCKIWLEAFNADDNAQRGDGMIYAVNATETPVTNISSVVITGIEEPMDNTALDIEAVCATTGISSTTPSVSWTPEHTTAVYNTSYTASVALTADTFYAFTDSTTATVNGKTATAKKNQDGTLTVTFSATAKDKLTSITAPQPITVANGTSYDAMELPETIEIVTEGNAVKSAEITWNTTNPASGSYDRDKLTEQTVTLSGTVKCPANVDANGIPLTTTITITIREADTVEAPQANLSEGTYTSNQSVELSSSTDGADIYYTTDGTSPSRTNGTKYTGAISVTGKEAQSVQTAIKAIAVKDKMQDSSVETFTYTIQIPDTTAPNAEIKIGINSWKEFRSSVTFNLFFKNTQTVTITARDNSGEAVKIEYLLSDRELSETELENATFTAYTNAFSISLDKKYVIYAKLTDTSDNYRYTNSEGIVLDTAAPVVSGIENGKTYCSAQTVTVTEEYIARVTVNGTEVQLNENNQFTLSVADGAQTIAAMDKAGNVSAEMIVTVNDGHKDENKDNKCDFCGAIIVGNTVPPAQKPIVKNDDNATTSADLSDTTSTSGGTTTAIVDKDTADKIVGKAVENKSEEIVIDATAKNTTAAASTTTAQVGIPTNTLGAIAEKTEADVTVKTDVAEVKMDNAAAGAVAEQAAGDSVQIIVEKVDEKKNKVEFQLKVVCSDGNAISDFKGGNVSVTVTIPKEMADKKVVCVYIDDDGRMSKVKGQKNADGTYTFTTGHFSTYALMTAEEADTAIAAQKEESLAKLDSYELVARSTACKSPSGKKAIRIRVYDKNGLNTDFFDGVEIYRSTKKNSGYGKKPIFVSKSGKSSYYNTAIKSGTKYYYKVRGFVIIDGQKYYTDWSLKAIRTVK